MKILMLSEGNISYNGRLIELHNVMKKIGDVTLISLANSEDDRVDANHYIIKKRKGKLKKLAYMIKSFMIARNVNFEVLFIDNTEACMIGLGLIICLKPQKIVLDSRELYLKEEKMSWKMRLLCFFERKVIRRADVHICANKYRANLMKKIYGLAKEPLVFENIRMIVEPPEVDYNYSEQIEKPGVIRIISTGGLIRSRALPIIEAMAALREGYELYILGGGSEVERQEARQIINAMNLKNVFLIGQARRSVMRYYIQKCDIGVVYYHGGNMNEKLCSSGKVYEYMQERKPFVGPKLLPLEDLCKHYGVGDCDASLASAILKVKNNYQEYQNNIDKYMSTIDVDLNNSKLSQEIKGCLNNDKKR
jgi:hypothetical protein